MISAEKTEIENQGRCGRRLPARSLDHLSLSPRKHEMYNMLNWIMMMMKNEEEKIKEEKEKVTGKSNKTEEIRL